MSNSVYIATSLDGYIDDKNNKIDLLHELPNPEASDFGFTAFMDRMDAVSMGRKTFDMVLSFDCHWPYTKPVYVLSHTMSKVPEGYENKIFLVKGKLKDIVKKFIALYLSINRKFYSILPISKDYFD